MVDIINRFNRGRNVRDKFKRPNLCTYDFTTMYTSIDLEDLKNRLGSLVENIFERRGHGNRFLRIDKNGEFSWESRNNRKENGDMILEPNKIKEMINYLVDNTYVKFAGKIWKQNIGIPMGTNCAGFMANIYCFTYELEFIKRLVDKGDHEMLNKFLYTGRYIDDLITIDNTEFDRMKYKEQNGGIYPSNFLTLNKEREGKQVEYMDLLIKHDPTLGIYTTIYDKREEAKFAKLNLIRYPHAKSMISDNAKLGVITSQIHRFSRICRKYMHFILNIEKVVCRLWEKGYSYNSMKYRLKAFILKRPHLYSGKASKLIYRDIIKRCNKYIRDSMYYNNMLWYNWAENGGGGILTII